MPNREAHSRTVPRVFAEDGGGYGRPARCALCGAVIRRSRLAWVHLPSDPEGVRRPLHKACLSEYIETTLTLDLPSLDVTPNL
jgi:hypothetical protein